ncbi:hypothetical protein BD414DRAFT_496078 [Trametes punicea]|nr:hypothetical protein BD414DRAFT_496078 [Trametes punicea]
MRHPEERLDASCAHVGLYVGSASHRFYTDSAPSFLAWADSPTWLPADDRWVGDDPAARRPPCGSPRGIQRHHPYQKSFQSTPRACVLWDGPGALSCSTPCIVHVRPTSAYSATCTPVHSNPEFGVYCSTVVAPQSMPLAFEPTATERMNRYISSESCARSGLTRSLVYVRGAPSGQSTVGATEGPTYHPMTQRTPT